MLRTNLSTRPFYNIRAVQAVLGACVAIVILFTLLLRNMALTGRVDRELSRVLEGMAWEEFRTAGHYRPFFDVVVVHTDSVPGGLADVLVHEAAHQLVAQQLLSAAKAPVSNWLNEGLASYFGFTFQGPDGRFVPVRSRQPVG